MQDLPKLVTRCPQSTKRLIFTTSTNSQRRNPRYHFWSTLGNQVSPISVYPGYFLVSNYHLPYRPSQSTQIPEDLQKPPKLLKSTKLSKLTIFAILTKSDKLTRRNCLYQAPPTRPPKISQIPKVSNAQNRRNSRI